MKALHTIAFVLVIIGGLNWLLIGIFDWGVATVLSAMVAKIIYILVGISAVYLVFTHKKSCKDCVKA